MCECVCALLPKWTVQCVSEQGSSLGLWHLLGYWTLPQVWLFYYWAPKTEFTNVVHSSNEFVFFTLKTHTSGLCKWDNTSPLNPSCDRTSFHLPRLPRHPDKTEHNRASYVLSELATDIKRVQESGKRERCGDGWDVAWCRSLISCVTLSKRKKVETVPL